MTDETNDLREELSIYDDGFPRDAPNWDEDAIVTPRAFLCEYGYDVRGERIPQMLGEHLLDTGQCVHELTLARVFDDSIEQFGYDAGDAARFLERDAYNAVEVYRIDGHSFDDAQSIIEDYAKGGFLIRYSNIMEDDDLKRTGHDRYGYYWMDINGRNELVKKLLDDPSVFGEGAADRAEYLKQEWEQKENPAAGEAWGVLRLTDTLSSSLAALARENLLCDTEDVWDGTEKRRASEA